MPISNHGELIIGGDSGSGGAGAYNNTSGDGGDGIGATNNISGTSGNDVIFGDGSGGGGGARSFGGTGSYGGEGGGGNDLIQGGAGDDIIFGDGFDGEGSNIRNGGAGGLGGGGGGGNSYSIDDGDGNFGQQGLGAPSASSTTYQGGDATGGAVGGSYTFGAPATAGVDGSDNTVFRQQETPSNTVYNIVHVNLVDIAAGTYAGTEYYGAGHDIIDGGSGSDHLFGLGDEDVFVIDIEDSESNSDIDTIWDFTSGEDFIQLVDDNDIISDDDVDAIIANNSSSTIVTSMTGTTDTTLTFYNGSKLELKGVANGTLTTTDFKVVDAIKQAAKDKDSSGSASPEILLALLACAGLRIVSRWRKHLS